VVVLEGWDLGEHVSVASSPQEAVEEAFGLIGRWERERNEVGDT
jgi:hypothetical protein